MASFSAPKPYDIGGRRVGGIGNFAQSARLGYAVGDPAWLNSVDAKVAAYWRGLEEGSTKHVGREITGLWGSGTRLTPTGADFYGHGAGTGQQFFPLSVVSPLLPAGRAIAGHNQGYSPGSSLQATYEGPLGQALAYLRSFPNGLHGHRVKSIIKRPIEAQRAYQEAFAQFDPAGKEREAVLKVLNDWERDLSAKQGGRFRRPGPITSAAFRERTGFLTGGAISGFTYSVTLAPLLGGSYQKQLVDINRILAKELSELVAEIQVARTKRPETVSGRLRAATTAPQNRFPS